MRKVVLVDDEKYAIVDMIHTFPWEKYDLQVVAHYTNPREALAAIGALEPDFLFTDIRMPGMSGLELIDRVKQMNLPTKFVIISGYSDFQYAQHAIRSGAFDYCLKPLDEDSANSLLQRLTADNAVIAPTREFLESENLLDQICAYLQANLQKPITLADISNEFHISNTTCCNLFASRGTTFSKHLMKQRMEYARKLLENSSYPINEIAEMCGFRDYGYFNKCFRRVFEMPPARYRNAVRKQQ